MATIVTRIGKGSALTYQEADDNWTNLNDELATAVSDIAGKQPLSAVLTATTASYTVAEQSKLSGIAAGATVNSADATLLARANHTGTQTAATISDFSTAADARVAAGITGKQDTLVSGTNIKTVNGTTLLGSGDLVVSGSGGNAVAASLAFGGTFTDKAQTVVTGQTWVAADSKITAQVLTPSGTDPDELYLLNLRPVISDLVPGTGFTVTLYTEAEARGTYTVNCIGV